MADDSAVIDWSQLDMLIENFADDFRGIFGEFQEEMPGLFKDLADAISSGEATKTARAAHQIKGTTANFGFARLSSLAAAIDNGARANDLTGAVELLNDARKAFDDGVLQVSKSGKI